MIDSKDFAGITPRGSPAPLTGAGRKRLPSPKTTSPELGSDVLGFRPDTGLSVSECDRARALIKRLLRRKSDLLPPKAKLPETEKEATYADAARIMARRLKRPVSPDAMRLAMASSHGPNPRSQKQGIGLTAQHHALISAEAEAMELHRTEVLRDILNAHFEIVPEA